MAKSVSQLSKMEITDNVTLRHYVDEVRQLGRELALELELRQEDLKGMLKTLPSDGIMPSYIRATLVSAHFGAASSFAKDMAKAGVRTLWSFNKHFEPELVKLRGGVKKKSPAKKFTIRPD